MSELPRIADVPPEEASTGDALLGVGILGVFTGGFLCWPPLGFLLAGLCLVLVGAIASWRGH